MRSDNPLAGGLPSVGNGGPAGVELRQLRVFVAIVESGSVTRAARTLGVAQSTASEAVTSLERALGVRVVRHRRGTRGLALTPEGEALLPHAKAVIAAAGQAAAAVASASRRARTHVSIVAIESVCTYLLPAALPVVRRAWPNTHFSVSVAGCEGVQESVAHGEHAFGLRLERSTAAADPAARVVRRPMGEVELTVFARGDHSGLRSAGPVSRDALEGSALYVSDGSGDFSAAVREFFTADGRTGPRLETRGSIEGVKRAVAADAGAVGLLPGYTLHDELQGGAFRALALAPSPPRMRLDALLLPESAPAPAVSALLDALQDRMAAG